MYRRRKFLGRYSKAAKKNYQIQRPFFNMNPSSANGYVTVIDPSTVTGVRKVKNFSIEMTSVATSPFLWALVYVPAGYGPNALTLTGEDATTMYKPTQNVIMSGMWDPQDPGATARRTTRLSRLLKAGDGLALVYSFLSSQSPFYFILTYAITL